MHRLRRHLPLFLLIIFCLTLTTSNIVLARDPRQGVTDYDKEVFDPAIESQDVNLQSTVFEIVLSIVSSLNRTTFCTQAIDTASGTEVGPCTTAPTIPVPGGSVTYVPKGVIPDLANINSSLLNRPAISSVDYIADVSRKLNLGIQPAYAQGIGYAGLSSLIDIWTAFRNIAYLFATAGFLVLAFMVMLRMKAGQGMINAQSSITKFIFVVLAITFSYAIAGFVIDLIYVFSGLIIAAFISTGLMTGPISAVESQFYGGSIVTTAGTLLDYSGPAGQSIGALATQMFTQTWSGAMSGGGPLGGLFDWSISNIAHLIIAIAMIYSLIKLFVQLLMAYLQIILYTLMAPLIILPDIMPGGSAFAGWLRNLFAHAMIFPATIFTLILGTIIIQKTQVTGSNGSISGLTLPFLNLDPSVLSPLIGIGFVLVVPKVNNMVKDFFKVNSFKYTSEIGTAVGVGVAGTRKLASPVTGAAGSVINNQQINTLRAIEGSRFSRGGSWIGRTIGESAGRRANRLNK